MAFGKNFQTPEEQLAFKVIDYFNEIRSIKDGEEKYQAVIDGEVLCWPFLEGVGTAYREAKKKIYDIADQKAGKDGEIDTIGVANAIAKVQQREARRWGIYGKTGIVALGKRDNSAEVMEAIQEEDAEPTPTSEV